MATDRELLNEAREQLKEQTALLEQLAAEALLLGNVIARSDDNKLVVSTGGEPYVVLQAQGAQVGDTVWLLTSTKQIYKKVPHTGIGSLVDIKKVHKNGVEIDSNGRAMLVGLAKGLTVEKGDRVMLDGSGMVVVSVIAKAPKPQNVPTVEPVLWSDIGGHREAKRRIIEAIELPYKHPKLFAAYGKRPPKGILLWGPPGCGKTLLGKAIATSIGATGGFISVKGPELLDPYVGVAEANVRALFRQAEAKAGKPGVIFVDEADALLAARGRAHNYMGQTIVPMFLTEMQGLEESGAIVILATNRADILDPAVIRDGRIDAKIEIPRPDQQDAEEILAIHIDGKPLSKECSKKYLAQTVAEDLYGIPANPPLPFSGALLEGLVAKASDHAIRRDLDCNASKPTGLCAGDFVAAMTQVCVAEGVSLPSEA